MANEDRRGTVCFLINDGKVLLGLLEYGPEDRKWNGLGGVMGKDETPVDAVVREVEEETHLKLNRKNIREVKVLNLPDLELHVLTATKWSGQEKIKDPTIKVLRWFKFDEVPYDHMWAGNEEWLPKILIE